MSTLPTNADITRASELRIAFYVQLEKASIAGMAYKSWQHPDIARAALNAYEGLADVERAAVSAHQQAYGRPTKAEMLRQACVEAEFPFEHADVDPDHWEFWAQRVYRTAVLPAENRGRELLEHAQRYSRNGRFFTAAHMLRLFVHALEGATGSTSEES